MNYFLGALMGILSIEAIEAIVLYLLYKRGWKITAFKILDQPEEDFGDEVRSKGVAEMNWLRDTILSNFEDENWLDSGHGTDEHHTVNDHYSAIVNKVFNKEITRIQNGC